MPRHASSLPAPRRRTDVAWPALRRPEAGGARGDGVQVAAQRIHIALKAAVDDEQADDISGEIHDEDDREDQVIRRPNPEVQREALHSGIELRAVHDRREQQYGDRRKHRQPQRNEPAHRAPEEDGDLRRTIEPRVEPVAGRGNEAKLARDAAVESVEELPDGHEHQPRDDPTRREYGGGCRAHPKRGPRHLIGREPEGDVHESQHRANAAVYSGTKNRSKFIHKRTTMRMASFALSETPTTNPCVTSGEYGYHGIFSYPT